MADVDAWVERGALNTGQGNALSARLKQALKHIERQNERAAVQSLQAFINTVKAFVRSEKLTPEQGQSLIDDARLIIAYIGD